MLQALFPSGFYWKWYMQVYTTYMYSSSINVKKSIVIQKQVLSIDNNWRNTEFCHRSGSVSHADTRGFLKHVSWDKEFTPYALNLNVQFISTEPHKAKENKLQRIQCIYQAWFPRGTLGVRVGSCLPPAFLPGFPGRLSSHFQNLLSQVFNLWNHSEWSPTYTIMRNIIALF